MTTLIETDRLIMRKFTLDDADAVFEFSTCEAVTEFTGDAGVVKTKADAKELIKRIWLAEYEAYGYARYALVYKADNKVIGFCGLKFETRINSTDIGYRLLPAYWGKGLATEAATATLEYAQRTLNIDHILGEAVDENIASNKLLKNVGFKFVKTYEEDGFTLNQYAWQSADNS